MTKTTKKNLNQWLVWLESLHPTEIELGLDRIKQVAVQLLPDVFLSDGRQSLPFTLITVGGTNGKGSTIAFIQSILQYSGYKTGVYTSPHLIRYNERIQINAQAITDNDLCSVFEKIEAVRGDISLTYFEYGTLAAIYHFYQSQCDVIVLEVGLGGRLDAVNILDADCSLITTVDLDHQDWLGDDIESIAREKAGIYRKNQIAIYGDTPVPDSIINYVNQLGVKLLRYDKDFSYKISSDHWTIITSKNTSITNVGELKFPRLAGEIQLQNASNAILALLSLHQLSQISLKTINQGIQNAFILGRYQYLATKPDVIIDVAHNPQAALMLNRFLSGTPFSAEKFQGQTHAIFSILEDKDISGVIDQLAQSIDSWHIIPVDSPRAMNPEDIKNILRRDIKHKPITCYNDFSSAYKTLMEQINSMNQKGSGLSENSGKNRIIVFGSFFTVTQALEYFYGA
jgi:dihydrofolate synthase / folylpolyglutamate synthase